METILLLIAAFSLFMMFKYKHESEQNQKPYIEIPLNELLIMARTEGSDMDKLGLGTTQISQTVDLNNVGDGGLVIYRQWLYTEVQKVKKVILNKRA